MKKIFFLVPALYLGGAETQFRNLISNMDNRKYSIDVYTLEPFTLDDIFIKTNKHVNFKQVGFGFGEKNKNSVFKKYIYYILNYIGVYIRLLIHFLMNRYDVIISYGMIMTPFIPLLKLFSKRLIFSVRTGSEKLYKRKYLRFLYKIPNIMTCNSLYTKKILEDININNVKVIFNGINTDVGRQEANTNSNKSVKIFIIARIHPIKNQLIALKAINSLGNVKLYMIGKIVDKEYYNKLVIFIKNNNLEDRVEFLQFTNDIKKIYMEADIILLPSFEEGLSNVILESFLYKRYCIASNIPQNSYLLDKRGGLFPPTDYKKLIQRIKEYEAFSSTEKAKVLTENFDYLKNNFSIDKMVASYEELLES